MTAADSAGNWGQKRKIVPASSLPGGFSSPLPRKAKIIKATSKPNGPEHPSSIHTQAVEEFVKRDKLSRRRAAHADFLRAQAISRNPRAGYVTTTFVQRSGDPRTDLRADAPKKRPAHARRTCKTCGKRKGIEAFPAGQRKGMISTVCGKCLKQAAAS